jgi:hypothetical protein
MLNFTFIVYILVKMSILIKLSLLRWNNALNEFIKERAEKITRD